MAAGWEAQHWAELAGWWHDLGKYQPEFQARLHGERLAAPHAGASAALAGQWGGAAARPLAFVLAGHHTGLANLNANDNPGATNMPRPLSESLADDVRLLGDWVQAVPPAIRDRRVPPLPPSLRPAAVRRRSSEQAQARQMEFWIRFLFSALVDADWLDTEAFCDPARAARRQPYPSIPELHARLDRFLAAKVAGLSAADQAQPVNEARAAVLAACRAAAGAAPGCFSLTVPTGGGKTLSALAFALAHAEAHGLERVITVIPFTSIIEQNAGVYRQALGQECVIEHQANLDPERERQHKGEELTRRHALAAENWDAPVIVTTTVQFFESLFANKPSRCRKLHNVARSVIVLDEVQSLPPGFLLSILDGLNELAAHYGCSVVLSTATPPGLAARERFDHGLQGVRAIVADPQELAARLKRVDCIWPGLDEPAREWAALAEELAAERQVLAIVHRRNDARELAVRLARALPEDEQESVVHLSALMCAAHRTAVLKKVHTRLAAGQPCRVVATQLIEAGVDVDFPVVYRALGGLDSLVQAAGRCNREGRLRRGRVIFFRAPSAPPCGVPRQALAVTEQMLREAGGQLDPADPALFEKFFRLLYQVSPLDAKRIQAAREGYNFATVARDFRLIEDGFTHTLVVPYGAAPERLSALRAALARPGGPGRESLRERLRALQPFTVTVYAQAFRKLDESRALEEVMDGLWAIGPGFEHLYEAAYGLVPGDEPKADPTVFVC